jgi:hypothetical protein
MPLRGSTAVGSLPEVAQSAPARGGCARLTLVGELHRGEGVAHPLAGVEEEVHVGVVLVQASDRAVSVFSDPARPFAG